MGTRFVQPLRIAVQWGFLLFLLLMGYDFYRFVRYFASGGAAPFTARPDGVEGFLPISALVTLRHWCDSGTISSVHPAALVVLLTVIVLAFLLKRAFCSWLCPVGTVEELLWKSGFTLLRRNFRPPRWLDVGLRGVKYGGLLFFLWSVFVAMAPGDVAAFLVSDYHKTVDVRLLSFFLHPSGTTLVVLGVLALLSLPVRNAFCRFLCPYGALLGLVSALSPVKVTRDGKRCVSCGVCTQVCPSYLPVMERERIHSPECVGCWRCVSHCRAEGALAMKLPDRKVAVPALLFALLVIVIIWGGPEVGRLTGHWHTGITRADYARLLGP